MRFSVDVAVAVAVYEERPLMPVELADRATAAVREYLDTLPHAEAVYQDYKRFMDARPDELTAEANNAVYRWQLIEKQATVIAARAVGEEPQQHWHIVLKLGSEAGSGHGV